MSSQQPTTKTATHPPQPDDHLCMINFGSCVSEHSSDCHTDSAVFHGICGKDDKICCVDSKQAFIGLVVSLLLLM